MADQPCPNWFGKIPLWRMRAIVRRRFWRLYDQLTGQRSQRRALKAIDQKLGDLRKVERPIRVGFIVCSPAKWSANALFLALADHPSFDCGFICTLSDTDLRETPTKRRLHYGRMRGFFAGIGPVWQDLYQVKSDRMHRAASIDCDIVFIQQPWGMQDLPRQLSGRVLCAYLHYGFAIISNDRMQFGLPDFHRYLWAYFAQTEAHVQAITAEKALLPRQVQAVGYPKLDGYLGPKVKGAGFDLWPRGADPARKRVIFAPHHAAGPTTLNMATFEWSGPAMLALAKQHPEIDFILKPHPNLGHAFQSRKTCNGDRYPQWLEAWCALPNCGVFDSGLYFDLFSSSDLMITDSGSFLAEYIPTGQPIVRLIAPDAQPFNASGQPLNEAFYRAADSAALTRFFGQLMIDGIDPLARLRQEKRRLVLPFERPAAMMIMDALEALLK